MGGQFLLSMKYNHQKLKIYEFKVNFKNINLILLNDIKYLHYIKSIII